MNIGTLPFKNIDLKIHDMILFLMHRSGADFQALPSGSLAHQGQRFQSIQRAKSSIESRIHFGSVPALCIRIQKQENESGKIINQDWRLPGERVARTSPPFFTACRLAPRISLRSLIKKIPQGCSTLLLLYVFHDVRFFLSLFFSFFPLFFASSSNSIVCHILPQGE